jgi:hypothetical protein
MSQFWGRHQNFFRQVLIAYKVPTLLQQVERALRSNQCTVIALMSTGEARTAVRAQQKAAKAASALRDADEIAELDAFVSPPQEILRAFIEQHFPTQKNGQVVPSAAAAKRDLLQQVNALPLPPNPLDAIIDHFGVDNVRREERGRRNGRSGEMRRNDPRKTEVSLSHF